MHMKEAYIIDLQAGSGYNIKQPIHKQDMPETKSKYATFYRATLIKLHNAHETSPFN